MEIRGARTSINYGLNKVRFPRRSPSAPRSGSAPPSPPSNDIPGGIETIVDAVLECEGAAKPACVAQAIHRYYA